jgi:hypothetical protein
MGDRRTPAPFLGSWKITTMELWARNAIDVLGPAFITFEDDSMGEFRFIAVRGWMDCRFARRDGKHLVEFSWQGKDERDEASGRGWAVLEEDGTMAGRIYFHQGDDSAFVAIRGTDVGRPTPPRRRPKRS